MDLVTAFVVLLQEVSGTMTAPTFESFVTVVTGWGARPGAPSPE